MANTEVYEWSLEDLNLIMYGIPVSGGGSDQGYLNLEPPEVGSSIEGVHGDSIAVKTGKSVWKAQLHLLLPSSANQSLLQVYNEQVNNRGGVGDFFCEHTPTGMQWSGKVYIRKGPSQDFKPEVGENVWELDVHQMQYRQAERSVRA